MRFAERACFGVLHVLTCVAASLCMCVCMCDLMPEGEGGCTVTGRDSLQLDTAAMLYNSHLQYRGLLRCSWPDCVGTPDCSYCCGCCYNLAHKLDCELPQVTTCLDVVCPTREVCSRPCSTHAHIRTHTHTHTHTHTRLHVTSRNLSHFMPLPAMYPAAVVYNCRCVGLCVL